MKRNILLLIIASAFIFSQQINAQVTEQDSLALVAFYNNGGGEKWGAYYNKHWLKGNVSTWEGVTVENKRVTKLSIRAQSGTIYSSVGDLSALTVLGLSGFSGSIPNTIGNLSSLIYLSLTNANITGNIPESIGNLNKLKYLYLCCNRLTGNIPESIGNLSDLVELELSVTKLTGEIPSSIGNLNSLEKLYLRNNDLSGEIPSSIGNLNLLESIIFSYNNLTGNLPGSIGNLSSLKHLEITYNNLTGVIPNSIGNLSSLESLELCENNISGEIPQSIGNLISLERFDLGYNNLSGTIPESIENLTNLHEIHLRHNNFSAITKIPANLTYLDVQDNNFDFDDLEPLVREGLSISGENQSPLILEKKNVDGAIKLTMNCGGTKNSYQWYYNDAKLTQDTNKAYTVPQDKDIQKLSCKAKNTLLPRIILVGMPPEETDCWQAGQLTFCVHSGKWEKASGSNKIKTTNIISVNDFLFFDGTMTIDTVNMGINADGKFYVTNIPLPGGSIGNYPLSQGKYNLKIMGKDGEITNFLNSKLEVSPKLFGVKLKLDNLQLVKDTSEFGLKIGCTMSVPGIAGSCEGADNTDISLNGLKITTAGISLGGVNIKNLGLRADGYCLKQLSLNYNSKKDILTSGMLLALPFGEVGGGFKLEEGLIDSIAWRVEESTAPFVLGSTTIGIKGFFGHISNITRPAIEVELGGIFSDIISDDLYKIEASGKTVWPTYFEVKGQGKFLRPVFDNLPFQLQGDVALSYKIPNNLFAIVFNGQFGTVDKKNWVLKGKGNFKLGLNSTPPSISGRLNGTISLKKLPNRLPYCVYNSFLSFPVELQSANNLIIGKNKLIFGTTSFQYGSFGPYSIKYTFDLSKPSNDENYIVYEISNGTNKSAIISEKSGNIDMITKTFVIPENTELAAIEINSQKTAPASTLTDNTGKKYTSSSENNNVLNINSSDSKQSFWLISLPKAGTWSVSIESPVETDTIITYFQLKQNDFKFTVNQTGNTITVNWDIEQVKDGQTVNILLDDNNADFDGFTVASGDAKSGQLSFSLDETTPDCSYYLFAQLIGDCSVVEAYADKVIDNPFTSLSPPLNFTSYYNSETGECEFNWDPGTEIEGYILTITDDQDNDSVYAVINGNQNYISLFIEDFETKSAEIKAYNQAWKIGCPSVLTKLTTGIEDDYKIMEEINKLKVYPNPTNGDLTIRYYVPEPSECEIRIFNIQGKEIARPLSGFQPAGYHQLNFQYENLPNGMYLIKYVNNNRAITVKSVFSK